MRELPIKRPIARVAVEAHRYRIIVVCSLRRTDWMTVTCVVVRRRSCAIDLVAAWRGCRPLTLRRLFRRGRDASQCELRVGGGLRRSDQLADGALRVPGLSLYAANYLVPDVFNTVYGYAEYAHSLSADLSFKTGLQFTDQRSVGAA